MIGQALGHYRIEAKLGEGGMGVVYRAFDTHLDRPVAIKILRADATTSPERQRRFVQEAKAASALNHPNIIHIYDISSSGDTDFIAMEFVAGKTLHQLIGKNDLPLRDTLKYSIQIADALARAHSAGIVHRDLKPANIIIDEDGRVKLLDFGLAKLTEKTVDSEAATATMTAEDAPLTEEGSIAGTVAYMSPEQAEGRKVDARSDIFSFGSVLYEMVTGRRPFEGATKMSTISAILQKEPPPPGGLAPNLPAELEKIILRCLRKERDRRTQHIDDVKLALEELRDDSASGKRSLASKGGDQALDRDSDSVKTAKPDKLPALVRGSFSDRRALNHTGFGKFCTSRSVCGVYCSCIWPGGSKTRQAERGAWRCSSRSYSVARFNQSWPRFCSLRAVWTESSFCREARKFAPWLRAFGLANGALAISMAVWMAEGHTILAALIAFLGIAIGVTALTLKPVMDQAAIYDSNR